MESRNCKWKKVDDLSKTRIRDPARGQVLVFKHIEWQTFRFVAKSELKSEIGQAPLRLIANQTSCRITLKKRLSDCAFLGARIMLIFDDLLWVLTDSQLLSALHFADYLGELIKRAPISKKFDNEMKVIQQNKAKFYTMNSNSPTKKLQTSLSNSISVFFSQYDFLETSFHFIVRRIEVHLMDDMSPQSKKSQCPELNEGGALQMTFLRLLIDLYPYQNINGSRKHWFRYNEPSPNRQSFINHKLKTFYLKQQANLKNEGSNFNLQSLYSHLLSKVLVIRLSDYTIGCVSTNSNCKTKKNKEPIKLISFDQSTAIPVNVNPIYLEFNSYFYMEPFGELDFPVPDTNTFIYIAPMRIHFEPITVLWINAFFSNLQSALIKLQEMFPTSEAAQDKMNIRAEILMPTIELSLSSDETENNCEYRSIEVKISRILLYNCDSFISIDYFKNLDSLMKQFSANFSFFYEQTIYPWLSCDMKPISSEFINKISRLFAQNSASNDEILPTDNVDVDFLIVQIEPIWIEFRSSTGNRYEPLLEPINVTLWINKSIDPGANVGTNILAKILDPVNLQLNHNQFLFILRLLERISEFTTMLNYDTYMIQRSHYKRDLEQNPTTANLYSFDLEEKIVGAIFQSSSFVTSIPEVNVFLVLKQESKNLIQKTFQQTLHVDYVDNPFDEVLTKDEQLEDLSPEDIASLKVFNDLDLQDSKQVCNNPFEAEQCDDSSINSVSGNSVLTANSVNDKMVTSVSDENIKLFARQNNLKKKSFSSNNCMSFDSSMVKVHFSNDNEDTLSTFSDISVDDSDHQSFIAMLNEGSDIDDIFIGNGSVEVAEEITEDFKFNEDEETLNECNQSKNNVNLTETTFDVLQIKVNGLNVIQQSSKGFLSQIFVKTSVSQLTEHEKLSKHDLNSLVKMKSDDKDTLESETNSIIVRIDSFNKGTLRDELISVFVQNLNEHLNKQTIDLIVDFFNDNIADKVAPTAILLENVCFQIIDNLVRVPPMFITIPKLKLSRNKENKWNIELDSTIPKGKIDKLFTQSTLKLIFQFADAPIYNQLLTMHLKIFERNLLFDLKDLTKEQDRLNLFHKRLLHRTDSNTDSEVHSILEQVLNQKDLLLQEIELLRKENSELRMNLEKKNFI